MSTCLPLPNERSRLGIPAFLRILQLSSPTLPIGAYAYSQGLEQAVERRWVTDEATAGRWIIGLLCESIARLDLPLLLRIHEAWLASDIARVRCLSQRLLASRESRELQEEEHHLGVSLASVLSALGVEDADTWTDDEDATFVGLFALGTARYGVPASESAAAYCFTWAEHQISAAARLIPLGQLAAQRVLSSALDRVPGALMLASELDDSSIGFFAPAQSMASALHETQYTRLFRS